MKDLRLKLIHEADFRKSEETNFLELEKAGKVPKLKKGEGILLISKSKNQIVFVEKAEEFDFEKSNGRVVHARIVPSQRYRLHGTTWDNLMLANYAERAGFRVVGIKRFEWYLRKQIKAA